MSKVDPKRPKRPKRRGGAVPKPRHLRASSLSASVVLHAVLITGAVFGGLFLTRSEAPRRIFDVKFDSRDMGTSLPEEEREELAQVEPQSAPVDDKPELLPEPVHPQADPDALRDNDPVDVPPSTDLSSVLSSEVVFGFIADEAEANEHEADAKADEADATNGDTTSDDTEDSEPDDVDPTPLVPEPEANPEVSPDDKPEPLHLVRTEGTDPGYPKLSLRKREEGDVVLRLAIDAEGRVTLVELAESSGFRRLDQAAMSAAPTWRFEVPITGPPESFEHTVHFRLKR